MIDVDAYRRWFAEEIEAVARLRTPALVEAFAAVPRERFLRAGPWTILADAEYAAGAVANAPAVMRTTPDADPRRVYHNIAVAIDPERRLFNGQPSTLAVWLDALRLGPGRRVLHIGAGLGYYTAVIAHIVGPAASVVAYEVDEALAAEAARNLAAYRSVQLRHGDGSRVKDGPFDAILVNAGVTHPLDVWLDQLGSGGRMVLPVTVAMPAMGRTIGKGLVFEITRQADSSLAARVAGFVAIYSAVGIRDDEMNGRIGRAMQAGPARWSAVACLRRDPHEPSSSCWLHGQSTCFSSFPLG
jgi:protein-L-isoaspartate(D-aspartate) O-methyltransferase